MSRLFFVSNRLPITVHKNEDSIQVVPSVGGLATGLASFHESAKVRWIGWPGESRETLAPEEQSEIRRQLSVLKCCPIFLSEDEIEGYYRGFSNQTLWPLFHYFPSYAQYDASEWASYESVNARFCDAIVEQASSEDTIWVHDYQLMLLPQMLRTKLPEAKIGFFLHIPFPSSEIIRLLPWRDELLEGLLGADLVGFHTFDYVRHFLASVGGIRGRFPMAVGKTMIPVEDRLVRADAFPMGIDFERFAREPTADPSPDPLSQINQQIEGQNVILSIDRLDYSKGMLHRLRAYERFLAEHPERHGRVTLILKAIASRSGIAQYDHLRRSLDEAVGHVNGRFGTLDWVPVRYIFRFLPEKTLIALYQRSDVALLTPLRDGMNLIAKEYLAAKSDEDGVLILSELAGAAQELQEALLVNPNNERQIANAIETALAMSPEEKAQRCRGMRRRIQDHDVERWAQDFLSELDEIHTLLHQLRTTRIRGEARAELREAYQHAASRLLLLGYESLLAESTQVTSGEAPSRELIALLHDISSDPKNTVAVMGGRGRPDMDDWFRGLPLELGAEHGVWLRDKGGRWSMPRTPTKEWKRELATVLEVYARRTPGSRVKDREYSLVWDLGGTTREFGATRVAELLADVGPMLQTHMLDVLQGDGFVEIKSAGVSQTHLAEHWLAEKEHDFVLCAGSNASDEDVFATLPATAYSIRIGSSPSRARYSLLNGRELLNLLRELCPSQR